MINQLSIATLNHLLAQQPELTAALLPWVGRTAVIRISLAETRFEIDEEGLLAASSAMPDATLSLSASLLPRLWWRDEKAYRDIEIEGDIAFATELGKLLQRLSWDAEEDLSRWVGDVVAHRAMQLRTVLFGERGQMVRKLAENLIELWTEERPLLAKRKAVERFANDVDGLRDDAERLEKRIQRLARVVGSK